MNKILSIEGDINNAINGFRKQLIESIKDKYEIVIIGTTTNKNINIPISTNSLKFYNLGKLSSNPIWLLFYLFKSIRIIVKENPILCLSFNLRPNILIGLICKFYPVKSIATITGTSTFLTNSNTFKNKLLQYIFKSINLIVFQNNNDKLMFDKLKIYQNKYSIVPGSGIDTSYYNHKRDYKKKEYTNFIFIARIIKEKGILEFIKAAEIVKKKGYSANFKILGSFYLGGKKNDRIDKSVIEFAAKSNLIEYLGETKNVIPYIIDSDCVVLPSYREGMSNLLLEAASLSTPIITTNVPGCKEIVENTYNGFLCNSKDALDLSEKLIQFINLSDIQRETMGKNGRIKVIKEFEKSIVIKEYNKIIESITG